jgi:rhodanese-related sulfurtransferase
MRRKVASTAALTLLAIVWMFCAIGSAAEDAPRIAKEEVKALLDSQQVAILDARALTDWKKSDKKIKGAVRVDPHDVGAWAGNYSMEEKIVVYCA